MGYWFYAKIGFPDPEGSSEEKYLLASDIEMFDLVVRITGVSDPRGGVNRVANHFLS